MIPYTRFVVALLDTFMPLISEIYIIGSSFMLLNSVQKPTIQLN